MTTAVRPWNYTDFNVNALQRLNERCGDALAELNLDNASEDELAEYVRLTEIRREQECNLIAYAKQRLEQNANDYEAQ